MTALRLISLPAHGALEMLLGFALMAAPIALGADLAGAALGIVLGALLVGLSLSSTGEEAAGRRPLAVSTHHAFDYGLALGLLGAAVVLGAAGDAVAAAIFAAGALAQLALNLTTRYSVR